MTLPPPPWPAAALLGDWALFLDIDGTLLELAATPDAVVVPDGLPARLCDGRARLGGALALVSGRALADIDRLFPAGFAAAGQHGLEVRDAMGRVERPPGDDAALRAARSAFMAFASAHPALLFEDKGQSCTLHYRSAPELEGAALAFAESVALRHGEALSLLRGKMIAEIKLAGANKGTAIARLMETAPFHGRRPLFLGDDLTDEYGFEAVNVMGGLSVKVGPAEGRATAATHRLAHPGAVRDWLAALG
jgi:trehalose 6-phosphate phosphatase